MEISPITEEELRTYVGPGWEHYQKAWKPGITGEGKIGGFNIGGFFFVTLWLSYRKMYRYTFVFFCISFILNVSEVIIRGEPGTAPGSIIILIYFIIIGTFGNRWYFHSARRAITQVHIQGLSQEESSKQIAKKGGTGFWSALGFNALLSIFLLILLFVISITIPPLYPRSASAYFDRGMIYYKKGNLDNAINDYDKAIELNPNYTLSYVYRGIANYKKGNLDYAVNDFSQAIQLNPNDANTYFARGLAYAAKGESQNAIADFTKMLEFCGMNTKVCQNAQQQLEMLGVK